MPSQISNNFHIFYIKKLDKIYYRDYTIDTVIHNNYQYFEEALYNELFPQE